MRIIGDYLLTAIFFGLIMYFLLPVLAKRQLSAEQRLRKTVWGALLFAVARAVINVLFP